MTRKRRFGSDGFHKLDTLTRRALLRYSTVARHFAVVTFGIPKLLANPLEPTNRRFPTDVPMDFSVSYLPSAEVFWCDGCLGFCYRGWDEVGVWIKQSVQVDFIDTWFSHFEHGNLQVFPQVLFIQYIHLRLYADHADHAGFGAFGGGVNVLEASLQNPPLSKGLIHSITIVKTRISSIS